MDSLYIRIIHRREVRAGMEGGNTEEEEGGVDEMEGRNAGKEGMEGTVVLNGALGGVVVLFLKHKKGYSMV